MKEIDAKLADRILTYQLEELTTARKRLANVDGREFSDRRGTTVRECDLDILPGQSFDNAEKAIVTKVAQIEVVLAMAPETHVSSAVIDARNQARITREQYGDSRIDRALPAATRYLEDELRVIVAPSEKTPEQIRTTEFVVEFYTSKIVPSEYGGNKTENTLVGTEILSRKQFPNVPRPMVIAMMYKEQRFVPDAELSDKINEKLPASARSSASQFVKTVTKQRPIMFALQEFARRYTQHA
ncbi:hypothetical protein HY486_04765 [Candidatus Woesearchaeota archaeon]|nr:hypothetical protein [Candidatus Woesearchaeota archaeon]